MKFKFQKESSKDVQHLRLLDLIRRILKNSIVITFYDARTVHGSFTKSHWCKQS